MARAPDLGRNQMAGAGVAAEEARPSLHCTLLALFRTCTNICVILFGMPRVALHNFRSATKMEVATTSLMMVYLQCAEPCGYIASNVLWSFGYTMTGSGWDWGDRLAASRALQRQVAKNVAKSKQQAEQEEQKHKDKQAQAAAATSSFMQPKALAMVPVASPTKANIEPVQVAHSSIATHLVAERNRHWVSPQARATSASAARERRRMARPRARKND